MAFREAPGRTRTCDPRIRNPTLYPAELRRRGVSNSIVWRSSPRHAGRVGSAGRAATAIPSERPRPRGSRPRETLGSHGTGTLSKLDPEPVKVDPMTPVSGTDPDLTRKERREQARTERKAIEAAAAQRARRKRMIQLGGVIGAVVVIIVVILLATSGGKKEGLAAPAAQKNSTVAAVDLADRRHPPVGQRPRQPQRARDAAVLRRPGVPDLQGVHARRAAHPDRRSTCAPGR